MVIYTCIGVSSVFSVAMLFFAIFQCGVYDNIWEFLTKRFTHGCVSDAAALGMTFTHGAITVITDWTFLSLPFFILRNTLMIKREKFAIGFVLAFGSISGIAAIARMPYIRILAVPKNEIFGKYSNAWLIPNVHADNVKDQIQNIAIWSAVEPAVGIIAGSLVTIRPLFRVMFPNASRSGGAAAASPMDIPSLATIATTQVDSKEEAQHDKLEAFYDSSFGSSRPMTPQSYTKQSGEMERARRPSETATLVGSPNKKRGVLNTEFQFPASPPPVFTPAPPYAAPQAVVRPKTAETLKTKQSKKAQVKETFLLDQTVDEPEKEEPVASVWSPPNWDSAQESPRRVAKPLLPTPTATVASTSIRESLQPASTPASRFQPIRPNPQHWELRDWDRRAEPVGMPGQNWQGENNLALPSNKAGSLRQSLLSRSSSQKTTRVFPSRGKSIREPGLPLDMFFGEQADDFSDTESNFDASTRQSRRTNFSG